MGFYTRTKKDQKDWSFCLKRLKTSPIKKGGTVTALSQYHLQTGDTTERPSDGSSKSSGYRLKLDDKYKPTDLTKLTSMEMEDILARAIILDRCKLK